MVLFSFRLRKGIRRGGFGSIRVGQPDVAIKENHVGILEFRSIMQSKVLVLKSPSSSCYRLSGCEGREKNNIP